MLALVLSVLATTQPPEPQFIATGWDHYTPGLLAEGVDHFADLPFDGVGLKFRLANGRTWAFENTFSSDVWNEEEFEPEIKILEDFAQRTDHKLKKNYLVINANPGNVDWFDDRAWDAINKKFALAGQIVRRGKLAGIIFDPEPYDKTYRQFMAQSQTDLARPFEEVKNKVRERGASTMRAFASNAPNATILCFYWLSKVDSAESPNGDLATIRNQWFELIPAWAEGWYESMPSTMRIVDGNEQAYLYNSEIEFARAQRTIVFDSGRLLRQSARTKYRAQTQVGHGLYLDAYINPSSNQYYVDGLGGERVWRLAANAKSALQFGNGIVWFWNEKGTFIQKKDVTPWEKQLPGLKDQLTSVRNELQFVAKVTQKSNGEELMKNQEGWTNWQDEPGIGEFTWTPQGAKLTGIKDGCWIRVLPIRPNELVCFKASAVSTFSGQGKAHIRIRFKNAAGKWMDNEPAERAFSPVNGVIRGMVRAPLNAGTLNVLLCAQLEPKESVTFTSVQAFRLR